MAKEAIMAATLQVIVRRGVHPLSVQDVAEEAGVSKALVHYHYGTKQNLLCQAASWGYDRSANRTVSTVAERSPDSDPLSALVDTVFAADDSRRPIIKAYNKLIEYLREEDLLDDDRSADYLRLTESYYAELIRNGVDAGLYDCPDPAQAAADMRVIISGTFRVWLREPNAERDACAAQCRRLLGLVVGEGPDPAA
jgi:AcrR family transcriptional regulator